jgi:hypothetical protein
MPEELSPTPKTPVLKGQWASLKKSLYTLFTGLRAALLARSAVAAKDALVKFVRDEPLAVTAALAFGVQAVTGVLPETWIAALPLVFRFFVYSPGAMDEQRAFDDLLEKYVPKEVKDEIEALDKK